MMTGRHRSSGDSDGGESPPDFSDGSEPHKEKVIRLILAFSERIVREGIRSLLADQPGIEIVGEAAEGRAAVSLVRQLQPNVAVIEASLPRLNGIDAAKRIIADNSNVRVLALMPSVHAGNLAGLIQAGAAGYMLKNCSAIELTQAIRTIHSGRSYFSPEVQRLLVQDYRERLARQETPFPSLLSEREREVLQAIAEGESTKAIAAALHLSIKTIETHRQHIMKKLDLHGVAELTKYALREGITSL